MACPFPKALLVVRSQAGVCTQKQRRASGFLPQLWAPFQHLMAAFPCAHLEGLCGCISNLPPAGFGAGNRQSLDLRAPAHFLPYGYRETQERNGQEPTRCLNNNTVGLLSSLLCVKTPTQPQERRLLLSSGKSHMCSFKESSLLGKASRWSVHRGLHSGP